jgi:ferric-dicitrate binding protein FerR (iron transport regulator)
MTERHDIMNPAEKPPMDDDRLEQILRASGRRPMPPQAVRDTVFAAAHAQWQTQLRSRQRRRQRTLWTAAAAVVVLGLTALLLPRAPVTPASDVLVTLIADRLVGTAALSNGREDDWRGLDPGNVDIHAGTVLRTSRGSGLGLVYPGGRSLRLDENSEIRFEAGDRVTLVAGGVYVDSGPQAEWESGMEIATHLGRIREIGTQFETRVSGDTLRVRVREGRVEAVHGSDQLTARASEEIEIARDRPVQRRSVEPTSPVWQWAQALAPAPYAEDITVAEFLDWVGRETGRRIHFAQPGLEQQAYLTTLHGNPRRFTPMEALSVMLRTTDLQYTVAGNEEILIGTRAGESPR